jgi:hypothetical protein
MIEEQLVTNVDNEYSTMTELDWAEYMFATIEYDYNLHPRAAQSIRAIFRQLYVAKSDPV